MPEVGLDRSKTGRAKGTPNKTTALIKEAIIRAAEAVSEDMQGKGKLTGYCKFLARTEPKAFAQLLGRILPLQVTGEDGGALQVVVQKFTGDDYERD